MASCHNVLLQYAVGVVLVVVIKPRGQRVLRVADQAVDERLQLRLRLAQVEAAAERRHGAATAEAG